MFLSSKQSTKQSANFQRVSKKTLGQGMTEYIIIVALVGVAAIAVYQFFGKTIRSQTSGIAKEIAGQTATEAIQNAQDAATNAQTEGAATKGLDSYKNDNARGTGN